MKKIVFSFGRMNPPTVGHQKLVDKMQSLDGEVRLYLSHTQNSKKDPLDYNTKIRMARKAFGNIAKVSTAKTVFQVLKEIEKDGYTHVTMVVGSDRVPEFKKLITKYNGKDYNFESVDVVSAGERDPDAEGVEGMSASKLRALAKEGDYNTFKSGLPKKLTDADAKKIYNTIRKVVEEMSEENQLDERAPLTIQQRMARSRQMKRYAPKIARLRKIKMKRMANPEALKKRAMKLARTLIRKRVAGARGADYKSLSSAEKITIDKLVAKKSAVITKLAKKLLPRVRKSEQLRLVKMRSNKSVKKTASTESFDINTLFEAAVAQDAQIKDKEGTQPKKYFSGLSKSTKDDRDAHFKKGKKASDDDSKAYKPAPGDAEAETKTSKHTKKYHQMFGKEEGVNLDRAREAISKEKEQSALKRKQDSKRDAIRHANLLKTARVDDANNPKPKKTTEEYELSESAEAALRKKADKSGIPYGTLKKVYDRGMAAWKTGHRPGATQQQWGFARVNSFITKGKGTWGGADKDLAKGVKREEFELDEAKKYSWNDVNKALTKANYMRGNPAEISKVASKFDHKSGNDKKFSLADIKKNLSSAGIDATRHHDIMKHMEESVDEACWAGYKQVGMKKKGDKMVPNCVPETKEGMFDRVGELSDRVRKAKRAIANGMPRHTAIAKYHVTSKDLGEASSPAQQAAIAISKKEKAKKEDKVICPKCKGDGCDHCDNTGYHDKVNASHCMSEDWFTKLMNKYVLKPRTYKYAKEVLRQVLDRKKKEGKLNHSVEYYAQQIAKQYNGVDARDLANMVTEELQNQNLKSVKSKKNVAKSNAGAGEWGTPELTAKLKSETPGEGTVKESCCEDCEGHYDHIIEEVTIIEADGKKKNVKLNDPFRTPSGPKKFSVYVKNEKGNVVKVNFGDPNMEIKRDDPNRRKSFRARHNCDNPGPKWKARYWSCYQWRGGAKVNN